MQILLARVFFITNVTIPRLDLLAFFAKCVEFFLWISTNIFIILQTQETVYKFFQFEKNIFSSQQTVYSVYYSYNRDRTCSLTKRCHQVFHLTNKSQLFQFQNFIFNRTIIIKNKNRGKWEMIFDLEICFVTRFTKSSFSFTCVRKSSYRIRE